MNQIRYVYKLYKKKEIHPFIHDCILVRKNKTNDIIKCYLHP